MRRLKTQEEQDFETFLGLFKLCDLSKLRRIDIEAEESPESAKRSLKAFSEAAFEDPKSFYRFLANVDSLDELLLEKVTHQVDDTSQLEIADAARMYSIFRQTAGAFKGLMERAEAVKGSRPTKFRRAARIDYILDKFDQLDVKPIDRSHFYGFRDFSRVKKCLWCNYYFIQNRKIRKNPSSTSVQVYCSPQCGNAKRQQTSRAIKAAPKKQKKRGKK